MKVLRTRKAFQKWRNSQRADKKIGFVPTMGALHEGHLSLVKKANAACDLVTASIFVNPTQFGPNEDFNKYPRTEKEDLALLKSLDVDAVFLPESPSEIYEKGDTTRIHPRPEISDILDGRFRPGHFVGVATVVYKLFQIVQPHFAYFGEKDYQQLQIIQAMVKDLLLDVKVVACPTKREKSNLALSSRNKYLSELDRIFAAKIYQIISTANSIEEGREQLQGAGFEIDYLEAWSSDLMKNISSMRPDGHGRWLVAVRYKGVRLIDNLKR